MYELIKSYLTQQSRDGVRAGGVVYFRPESVVSIEEDGPRTCIVTTAGGDRTGVFCPAHDFARSVEEHIAFNSGR